jgi:hypothetical protein
MPHTSHDKVNPEARRALTHEAEQPNEASRRPDAAPVAQLATLTFLIGAGFLLVGYALS